MNQSIVNKSEVLGSLSELKRIYNVLENSFVKPEPVVLAVTSGMKGEGKTTITAGIANIAAKMNGTRVVAFDYNLYSPALHNFFGVNSSKEKMDFTKKKSINQLVEKTSNKNIDIIPAFKLSSNGGNRSSNGSMNLDIIQQAKQNYDLILLDTSAAFPLNRWMTDPVTISKHADFVVMVTLTNVTPRKHLKRASIAIESTGSKILGVIANQWKNPIMN